MINIPSERRSQISMIVENIAIRIDSNHCRVKASIPEIEEKERKSETP
jgi:hypothetical protein